MMIHLSVAQLLYGLGRLATGAEREFEFVGVDGAFVLHFRRSADGTVTTQYENRLIDESGAWELLRSAVAASRRFADEWLPRLPEDDAGAEDLVLSLDKANQLLDSR
jgi:hypothetical protein